jgi:hypothetical protein
MSNTPKDTELSSWHRYFAIQNNNRAWTLVEQENRTPGENNEMLNTAHAAAFHWEYFAKELNSMRATMLLAEVHALMNLGETAFQYAEVVKAYFINQETPDWELAFTYAIHAHAAFSAGKIEIFKESYAEALKAIEAINDEEDRNIVMQTFKNIPLS